MSYNLTPAPAPFAFSAATTTAQFQSYLNTVPGLTSPTAVTVTGNQGGPFTVAFAAGLDPTQLDVASGPAFVIVGATTVPSVLNSSIDITGVPVGRVLSHLQVHVAITHENSANLQLTLIAPDGTKVPLATNLGFGPNFDNTTFDDQAPFSVTFGGAPFQGSYQPQSPLSALAGKGLNGNWTLQVTDNLASQFDNNGILAGWSMTAQTQEVLNNTATSVDVTFDRDVQPATFTTANVLSMMSPAGPIVPYLVTFGASGQATFAYNGVAAPTAFTFTAGTSTAAQLQAYLGTIAGLTAAGSVSVTGTPGGPFTVLLTGSLNSATLTVVSGPATIASGFTVSPNPAGTPVALANRTFRIGFPVQSFSGNYSLVFGPDKLGNYIKDVNGNAVDTNLNAGVDVLRGADPVNGVVLTVPVSSGNVNLTLPPGQTVSSTINVPNSFLVQGTTVTLSIQHNNDPDLTATLFAPDGTSVQLFSNVGASGSHANFTNTTLDDLATSPIQLAAPVAPNGIGAGPFNPQFPLSAFKDHASAGNWTLVISSASSNITGKLLGWTLTLKDSVPGSGLGEPVADQFSSFFRVFVQDRRR